MTNKRIQKLIKNIRVRSRGQESSNRGLQDEHESQDTASQSHVETQNDELESQQNKEFSEEGYNEVRPSSQRLQNRRGKTVMRDVHSLHPDDLLVVQFNERGQPYGEMQATLANYVGTIARNGDLLPLSFLDWRRMPLSRLDEAWRLVTAHFCIPNRHRDVVMQMMGVAWRRWRTEVKATSYDSNTPLDELLCMCPIPHGLTPEVWKILCHYWKSSERTSKINRENANKRKRIHVLGRTNIASLEEKFFEENGRKPTRVEILELSQQIKKKRGAPVDDEAIPVENSLNEVVRCRLEGMPKGTQPIEVHEEAFREVFGPEHSGRVRCLGAGALPSQVFPELSRRRSICRESYLSASDVTNKLREMEEKIKDMEARQAQRHAEMEMWKAKWQKDMEMLETTWQAQIEQMMKQMQEYQLQNFARIIQSMISGAAGGSHRPESLPAQMAAMMAYIMQQYTYAPSNVQESSRESTPSSESDSN